MFNFTSLFFNNMVGASMNSLFSLDIIGSLESCQCSLTTTTSLSATETTDLGTNIINVGSEHGSSLVESIGIATTSTGTSVSINAPSVYEKTLEELKTTQAYVESLNQEELSEMIAKLEQKDIQLSLEEEQHIKTI